MLYLQTTKSFDTAPISLRHGSPIRHQTHSTRSTLSIATSTHRNLPYLTRRHRYVEAVGSTNAMAGLQYMGLNLPENQFGAILRYQTDHDNDGRVKGW